MNVKPTQPQRDEWLDIDQLTLPPRSVKADVSITMTRPLRKGARRDARASLCFRGEAKDWLIEHGPTFKIAISSLTYNRIRITPDPHGRRFVQQHGVVRIILPPLSLWPNESRKTEAAREWDVNVSAMIVELRSDWAKSSMLREPNV